MKNDGRVRGWEAIVCAAVASAMLAGCTTTGSEPAKKSDAAAKKTTTAKVESARKPVAAVKIEAAKPAQPAKPRLAMPQVERPTVQPVVIPAFGWQDSKVAPSNRTEVLAAIEKKYRPDDFDAMIRATDMDGKQLAGFLAAVDDRLARLAAWDSSEKGKRMAELKSVAIPAALEGTNEDKVKTLVTEYSQLDAEYRALRTAVRAMVMGVMTLQQQRMWAAQNVVGAVTRGMRGVELDAGQQKKALAICLAAATDLVKEDTVANDPYLGGLLKGQEALIGKTMDRVKAEVLTKEQRAKLTP